LEVSTALVQEFFTREQAKLQALLDTQGTESPVALRKAMERIMMEKVGLFRNGPDPEAAVTELANLLGRSRRVGVRHRTPARTRS